MTLQEFYQQLRVHFEENSFSWDKITNNKDYLSFLNNAFEEGKSPKDAADFIIRCVKTSVFIKNSLGWKDIYFCFNSDLMLMRNHPWEFYRIYRDQFKGKNLNFENYVDLQKDFSTKEFQALIEKLKNDPEFRFQSKSDLTKDALFQDKPKTITDAPGFGSGRLSLPYESEKFDREFFNFCNQIVEDDDIVIDYGGGISPFLVFLDRGKKFLVDINNFTEPIKQYGIEYIDAFEWNKKHERPNVIFCFQTLEHVDNPEELLKMFSKADICVFSTPNKELLSTSVYHHILMDVDVFKEIFKRDSIVSFLRTSEMKAALNVPLDIHGVIVSSPKKWNLIKDNKFFKENFKLST